MRHASNAAVVEVHACTRACTHAAKQLGIAAFLALFLATTLAHAQPPRTARGTTGAIDVASAQPLRAKAVRDSATPILVRVNALEAGRYRIEYIGALEGTFDLAPLIEQTDGRAADALPDLRVEVYTQLPPNHGTDVFGLSAFFAGRPLHHFLVDGDCGVVCGARVLHRSPRLTRKADPRAVAAARADRFPTPLRDRRSSARARTRCR